MSDLSQLLDDLYALPGTDTDDAPAAGKATAAPAAAANPRAPEWSSEEALDDVFASWVPGPDDDASATERSVVGAVADTPVAEAPTFDEWLAETAPLPDEAATPVALAETIVGVAATPRWTPADDDILPGKPNGSKQKRAHAAPRNPRFALKRKPAR